MKNNLKILMVAAEAAPIAKVGGLADVIGSLPKALSRLNLDIRLIIPFYQLIDRKKYNIKLLKRDIEIVTSVKKEMVNLWQAKLPETQAPLYLIEHDFFKGSDIYSSKLGKVITKLYPNDSVDIEKFVFFSHACLACLKALKFKPEIIHLNDWHTAAITLFLKTTYRQDKFFSQIKTLYTIHNLANQGIVSPKIIALNKLDQEFPSVKIDLKNRDINLMAQGIVNADLINTVSPTYAKEISTRQFAAGLKKVLAKRKNKLYGILNGIDTKFYNPVTDNLIKQNYNYQTLAKKEVNKIYLQKKLGLPVSQKIALVGLVSRLVWQKGLDLINDKFVGAMHASPLLCQFVILGTGQKKYEQYLLALAKRYAKILKVIIKFDEALAHQIYAAANIFLMPSRFEPCGLGQMIAMRYGAVPVVRATGGLSDTVDRTVGFSFKQFSQVQFNQAINQALKVYYQQPSKWQRLQINGLKKDFAWEKSAKEYLKLYQKLIEKN